MATVTIGILEFYNNYYNRIKKPPLATYEQYVYASSDATSYSGVNFNYGDGINTTFVLNDLNYSPDYLVVTDALGNVQQRWFVIESKYERNGQHTLTLKRDVIADYYQQVISAPCLIEKATLQDDNPLIFNSEGMTFNQIKKSETLLKDKSKIAWIVGYVSKTQPEGSTTIPTSISATIPSDYQWTRETFITETGLTDIGTQSLSSYSGVITSIPESIKISLRAIYKDSFSFFNNHIYLIQARASGTLSEFYEAGVNEYVSQSAGYHKKFTSITNAPRGWKTALQYYKNQILQGLENQFGYKTESVGKVKNCNGDILYDEISHKYFKVVVSPQENENVDYNVDFNPTGTSAQLTSALNTAANYAASLQSSISNITPSGTKGFNINYSSARVKLTFVEVPGPGNITASFSTSKILEDAPYKMFCIPYGRIGVMNNNLGLFSTDTRLPLILSQAISSSLGSWLIDMQLLPYCPLLDCIEEQEDNISVIKLDTLTQSFDYDFVKVDNENRGIILWCSKSTNTFNIPIVRNVKNVKIENECDFYRIVSPNYQGIYEFNLAKNGGLQYINVDYTYRPYSPYIHLNPSFNGLYGQDFDDARGLICGGDFSVAIINDAWKQYEINNKNYQNIFDRQVQNQDVMHKYQMAQGGLNALTGSIQGSMMGFMFGGAGGAIAGGVASLAGGVADNFIQDALYRENKNSSRDIFNYQLGNIKALPQSLTKNSSLTANNKIYPFLEYYTCTDAEKEALTNKLKYNGMTVMATGKIENFINPEISYIQAQLIRLDNVAEDAHFVNEIANELARGVYI